MKLEQVIQGIAVTDRRGRMDCDITSITSDSRRVVPGALFVAIRGAESDGHGYISSALGKGAVAVLAESWSQQADSNNKRPRAILVKSGRRALALAASNFYGQPSRKLLLAGVTGTNGKTTVTYILESIIKAAARKVGLIGTVEARYEGKNIPLKHTTPDPVVLMGLLAEMRDAGVTHAVMEVSSHALHQDRVAGADFKVCGFTNLTQDHLDYHGDLEAYFQAKARLFSDVMRKSRARGRMAVINVDDPRGDALLEAWGGKSLRVSLDPQKDAEVVALSASYSLTGTEAEVRTPKGLWNLRLPLIGAHNLSNALVAVGMALAMGFSKARIVRGLSALERVPGRLEPVPNTEKKMVFVDYAHTPDALERVLACLRPLTKGRLIVVFGCGGDRDRAKRPLMGLAVARGADLAVVTNDNPRSEDPKVIAEAVEKGLLEGGFSRLLGASVPRSFLVELDRRSAIRTALRWQAPDDVVLIAGKGHETYQVIGRDRLRFEDREEARRMLAGEPPPPPELVEFQDVTGEVDASQVEAVEPELPPAQKAQSSTQEVTDTTTELSADDIETAQLVPTTAASAQVESGASEAIEDAEVIDEAAVAEVEAEAPLPGLGPPGGEKT